MIPFAYVVYTLAVGLEEATKKMEPRIAATVRGARWLTIISWCRESASCGVCTAAWFRMLASRQHAYGRPEVMIRGLL